MAAALAALGALCSIVSLVCVVMILIAAFQDETAQGFLCLCIPFYILYYAFARLKSEKKGALIGGWLGAGILGAALQAAAGAMAQGV